MSVPNVNDLVAGETFDVPAYYVYDPGDDTFTAFALDYSFDDKVSVVGAANGTGYAVEVLLNGADDLLFTGTDDGSNFIPKAVALECGALTECRIIDLSAGPMTLSRYLSLGATARKDGAYLLTMKGTTFVDDLLEMDAFKSIAMIDIDAGVAVLDNHVAIGAGYVEIAGGSVRIEEDFGYSGDMTIVDGSVNIQGGDVAVYNGVFNDLGKVDGGGVLELVGGDFSVGIGAEVDVKTWMSRGTKTRDAIDYVQSKLNFTGNFIVGGDTEFVFFKSADLTVNSIENINGLGGVFTMDNYDPLYNGDETIDVLGAVAKGEAFKIGTTDVLELGEPTKFNGVIDSMTIGSNATSTAPARAGGEIALVGIWNFVSLASADGGAETIVTMKDVADGLLAHIAFAGAHAASYFSFYDQLKGVTPTTVITPFLAPPT